MRGCRKREWKGERRVAEVLRKEETGCKNEAEDL